MSKVSMRGGFSDRNMIKPENKEIQINDFDKRTRIQLQNMINEFYTYVYGRNLNWNNTYIQEFIIFVLGTVYAESVNVRQNYDDNQVFKKINKTILEDEYDDVLTLIEALIRYWDEYLKKAYGLHYYDSYNNVYSEKSLFEMANSYLEREFVGYRFVDGIIIPISDEYEIQSITEAISSKHDAVREHLAKANRFLSDRARPDYENSIKESISAVEAMAEIITGIRGKDATLGKMLNKLEEKGITIHGSLRNAFKILYGYTSDANGIRHAGDIGGPSSTFEEAKFMLITCCAFINYLTALSSD